MKDHPILFSAAMVRALLDGSKTQTRRAVTLQVQHDDSWVGGWKIVHKRVTQALLTFNQLGGKPLGSDAAICPYGQPGDRLWVRETWVCDDYRLQQGPYVEVPGAREALFYRADNEQPFEAPEGKFWKPSIHMPRWASRILLEIVSVRVEQLNDCSRKDAIAEGIHRYEHIWRDCEYPLGNVAYEPVEGWPTRYSCPVQAYQALWESINGAGSWDDNPWVWVVEFKRVAA